MKLIYVLLITTLLSSGVSAQGIKLPERMGTYPRLLVRGGTGKDSLTRLLTKQLWAREVFDRLKAKTDPYADRHILDSTWIVSRLQMYWQSHATDVFVRNGVYAYASGHAPVATVRFTGTRDAVTVYTKPRLEDVKPYMGEDDKLYLQNSSLPAKPWETVDQSKSGRIIESINIEIIEKARDASFLYWYTGDEKYAKFAYDIFNTYANGIYYRNEPVDLNHGHDQTLLGLSAYEVIHEDILGPLTICYDFLHQYLEQRHRERLAIYDSALKKWADLIIKNGVPYNNWDLIEARFVSEIALVLGDDSNYPDKKGCQYYLDQIINKNATRQWSLSYLLDRGYDASTGIWGECPGYSLGVMNDFTQFVTLFDHTLGADLLIQEPIIAKAVLASPQYLYPNGFTIAFGDTHYGRIKTFAAEQMVLNARHFHKPEQELLYTRMINMLQQIGRNNADNESEKPNINGGLNTLFAIPPPVLDYSVKEGTLQDFATATFYAPNVSYFVQRNGFDVQNGLMISQAGSEGNHAHANGIAMELYGKGVVLAPEGGIGTTYFQSDYAEYYSQFPAHNTVIVDGISAYPVMKSHHPFNLKACYPLSGQKNGYFNAVTFSDVSFLEPESNAEQDRLMSIIRTGDSTGFYVDIFRSRKKAGGDKYHDYIYHNLGQQVVTTDGEGRRMDFKPTEKLTFANEELIGYDYWYDKKSVSTSKDFKAQFKLKIPGVDSIFMNMWMKGYQQRELFNVMAPPSKAFNGEMVPKEISDLPLPTIIVRQQGEAWKRPFVAVYEPVKGNPVGSVVNISTFNPASAGDDFVGIAVENKSGVCNFIFSSFEDKQVSYKNMTVKADYAIVTERKGKLDYLFLGKGTKVGFNGYNLESPTTASGALWFEQDSLWFTSNAGLILTMPDHYIKKKKVVLTMITENIRITGSRRLVDGRAVVIFHMPVCKATTIKVDTL